MGRRLGVIIFFIVLVFVFTYPLVLRLGTGIYGIEGFRGDPLGTMWWMWWYGYAWENGMDVNFVPVVAYPFGMSFSGLPVAPFLNYPVAVLNFFIKNEILTYNLAVLLGIFLTSLCMFFLVRYLTKSNLAGLLGGIVFGFCPNQLMHSAQHLGFTLNFWIPLYVLCLFKLKDYPSVKNSLLCAFGGVGVVLTNYYYGYFMLIFTVVFLLFWRGRFKYFLWSGIVGFSILAPFIISILLNRGEGAVYVHPIGDLIKYSARWYDYFLPSELHPLFGRWAERFSRHYFERSLYIGYIPIALGLWAIFKNRHKITKFFGISSVVFFIFSLSPIFQIGSVKIPNLSFFAYRTLPMFRVHARMGILVIFAVGVLAGFGLKWVLEQIKRRWVRDVAGALCVIAVLFEYMNFPPFHNIDLSRTPKVYEWLRNEPEDIVIVEYPFVRSIEARHSEYLFYQRVHRKKMINGSSEGTIGDAFRRQAQYPQLLETSKLLAYLGADYMIVHEDEYNDTDIKEIDKNPGLRFVRDFPGVRVYKIVVEPDDVTIVFWQNFASWEKWDDGNYWRWLGNNATVWIDTKETKTVDIVFRVISFAEARELQIYINDILANRLYVISPADLILAQKVVLKNILLKSGENMIRFYTPQGEMRIGDILGNSDNRRVSFAVNEFGIMERTPHAMHGYSEPAHGITYQTGSRRL